MRGNFKFLPKISENAFRQEKTKDEEKEQEENILCFFVVFL